MLKVIGLSFDYEEKALFNAINFSVESGQLLHLRGSNGAGKTTLLKLLAGLLQPNAGSIVFNGQPIDSHLSEYQSNVCFVGHKSGLSSQLTVRENYLWGNYSPSATRVLDDYLRDFNLMAIADTLCGKLSMGQRRRASLLRLMMTPAKLWLLDEPFTALDKEAELQLQRILKHHLQQQGLIIMTSHQAFPSSELNLQEYML